MNTVVAEQVRRRIAMADRRRAVDVEHARADELRSRHGAAFDALPIDEKRRLFDLAFGDLASYEWALFVRRRSLVTGQIEVLAAFDRERRRVTKTGDLHAQQH